MDQHNLVLYHQLHKLGILLIEPINIKQIITWVLGQSKDNEFFLSACPLGLITYDPDNASTIPCPPDVPGKNACNTALDSVIILSINIGLPASNTVTNGIFLSYYLICDITSY